MSLIAGLVLISLAMLVPGYAVVAAMFPPGTIARGERFVYTVTASVAAAALGGLVVQSVLGLSRLAWALTLVSVTVVAAAVARRRRVPPRSRRAARPPNRVRIGLPTAAAVLAAAAIAVAAVAVAVDGLHAQRAGDRFSALWAIPRAPGSGSVEIGVWNHQTGTRAYRIRVTRAGATLKSWAGRLGPHESKRLVLTPPATHASEQLVVTLYRDGRLYRRTKLRAGGGA